MRALEHEQRLVARERNTLSESEARMRQREDALRQREETFRKRLDEELETQLRQARKEIDAVIEGLKSRAAELSEQARLVSTGDTGTARSDARAALEAVSDRIRGVHHQSPSDQSPDHHQSPITNPQSPVISVGSRVIVGGLGLEATVTALHDATAELEVRGKRMRASVRDLRAVGGGNGQTKNAAKVNVHVELQPRETAASDLNVIGCTVDEALSRAERFLDESLLTDHRTVRFIHGYGTGQLKRALADFLQQHPLVARFDAAPPNQGGGGVTVVELKE